MSAEDIARGRRITDSGKYATNGIPHADEQPPFEDDCDTADSDTDSECTWEPMDLGPYLTGTFTPPATTLGICRSDGLRLIYPGREHVILGETESGKTWLALGCVAAELTKGNHVVYIHYEEGDPVSTIERLRLLGVSPNVLTTRLRFVSPDQAPRVEWVAALLNPTPTLVVHDGVNEAMSLMGADIMGADGASLFRRILVTPFRRVGAASIACDHLPKDRRDGGRDAYGSVHKGNALDGARIELENIEPFGKHMRGASFVFVTKDRPGSSRAHGRPTRIPGKTFMGVMAVDAATDSADLLMFFAPKDDDQPAAADHSATEMADTVYEVIAAQPDHTVSSGRALFAAMRAAGHQCRDETVRDRVADLIHGGRLTKSGKNGYRAVVSQTASDDETESL